MPETREHKGRAHKIAQLHKLGHVSYYYFWIEPECVCWSTTHPSNRSRTRNTLSHDRILEVRPGHRTLTFEKHFDKLSQGHVLSAFSIIHFKGKTRDKIKTIDLICKSPETMRLWVSELRFAVDDFRSSIRVGDKEIDYAVKLWGKCGARDEIRKKECLKLARGYQVPRRVANRQYRVFDENGDGKLQFDEFCKVISVWLAREDIAELFRKLAGIGPDAEVLNHKLQFEQFQDFLQHTQSCTDDPPQTYRRLSALPTLRNFTPGMSTSESLTDIFGDASRLLADDAMSFRAFSRYLGSTSNGLTKQEHSSVCEDMTRPITDYFIHSSHNTYLTGDQLTSKSSVDMYIQCFRANIRSVELDLWDGPDGNPVITHGHSATSTITAEDVIKVIREYAFSDRERNAGVWNGKQKHDHNFPVIISLENHLSLEQQKRLAELFISILGDRLALPEPDGFQERLKSPAELAGKVLLKGKRSKDILNLDAFTAESNNALGHGESQVFEDPDLEKVELANPEALGPMLRRGSLLGFQHRENRHRSKVDVKGEHKVKKICKELSDITYLEAVKIKNWEHSWSSASAAHMSSFGDAKLGLFARDADTEEKVVRYNVKQLARIYPSPTRDSMLKSANFDPMPFWALGCQLVSMNFQTNDKNMRIAQALFDHRNGGCGYTLKPEFLRRPHPETGRYQRQSKKPCTLRIEVISGQDFPKHKGEIMDPFVYLEVCGLDCDRQACRTSTVRHNSFKPQWREEFVFDITTPELAILYLEVFDEDITTAVTGVGYYAVPVALLNQGYRHVPLLKPSRDPIEFASLFLSIRLEGLEEPLDTMPPLTKEEASAGSITAEI